jgi:vacuolar-type H+-ATPase subunit C/Vma6
MTHTLANDVDYLTARVHGRRSRMAETDRLEVLCRSRSLPEFARTVYPEPELVTAAAFQRHSVQSLIRELSGLRLSLAGADARLLDWLLVRYQVENLKVLLRACAGRIPFENCQEHLVELPKDLTLDDAALAAADSLGAFVRILPRGLLRQSLEQALAADHESPRPFFYETALDRTYLQELLARAGRLSGEDKEVITALVQQEADHFHLMLVARGRFHYELPPDQLLPRHIAGTRIPRARFAAMLGDADVRTAMTRAVGRALDELPLERGPGEAGSALDAATVEKLAWKRFVRLANRAFRGGHVGLGAIAGYIGLRRAEAANLITLSEGLRLSLAAETLRARMIPRADLEVPHV